MKINQSKINLTNKICSTLFFAFAIINFILSILAMVNIDGNDKNLTSKNILNFGLTLTVFITIGLNVYLIIGMVFLDKKCYKNAMLYIFSFICLFSLIAYIYSIVGININYISSKLTSEFWLLLIAGGISIVFGCWYCLIKWNLLKELTFNSSSTEYSKNEIENHLEPTDVEATNDESIQEKINTITEEFEQTKESIELEK